MPFFCHCLTALTLTVSALALGATAQAEEFRLGVILSLTGGGSVDSKEDLEGIQIAVDEINAAGGLLGKHPIVLSVKDDTAKADVAVTVAKALIAEKPRAMIGVWSSGCALAVKPLITEAKVLMIAGHSNSEDITKLNPSPYVYSVVPNTYMLAKAIATSLASMAKDKGWKTYATIASDYPFGRSLQSNVVASLKTLAPNLVLAEQRWPKLGETEYPAHLGALAAAKPDFIFNGLSADDLKRFISVATPTKFTERFPCPGAMIPVNSLQDTPKENLPMGSLAVTRAVFAAHLDQPMMQRLITAYQAKRNGRFPSDWVILHYDAVMALKQGVDKAASIETDAIRDALKSAEIDTTRGRLAFRAIDNQLACPVYLGTLAEGAGYPFPFYKDLLVIPASDTMRPVAEVEAARQAK
jgi:branched-chain amino acid transport system substrate-binding protein